MHNRLFIIILSRFYQSNIAFSPSNVFVLIIVLWTFHYHNIAFLSDMRIWIITMDESIRKYFYQGYSYKKLQIVYAIIRWWKRDSAMLKTRLYDNEGPKTKQRYNCSESTMAKTRNHIPSYFRVFNFSPSCYWFFIIVLSYFHHRGFVVSTFTIVFSLFWPICLSRWPKRDTVDNHVYSSMAHRRNLPNLRLYITDFEEAYSWQYLLVDQEHIKTY